MWCIVMQGDSTYKVSADTARAVIQALEQGIPVVQVETVSGAEVWLAVRAVVSVAEVRRGY